MKVIRISTAPKGRQGGPAGRARGLVTATALMMAVAALSGCAAVYDPTGFSDAVSGRTVGVRTDEALAALAKGDWKLAEDISTKILRQNPTNGYALLVLGAVYEHTKRPIAAYDSYESAILTSEDMQVGPRLWNETDADTVHKVAMARLRALKADGVHGTRMRMAQPTGPGKVPPTSVDGEKKRFAILDRLYGEAMVTPEEYEIRKIAASKGAASRLPPPPTFEDVAARLEQIRVAFESRNLGPAEHAAEREAILDSLIPLPHATAVVMPVPDTKPAAAPPASATPETPAANGGAPASPAQVKPAEPAAGAAKPVQTGPEGVPLESAPVTLLPAGTTGNPAATLRSGRSATDVVPDPVAAGAEVPKPAAQPSAAPKAEARPATLPETSVLDAPKGMVAVHLASFRSEEAALQGWSLLRVQFPSLMGLQPKVTQVKLPDKGTYYRLNAGPLASREVADDLCKTLTDQYCEVAYLGG